jgi:hypothetical protein
VLLDRPSSDPDKQAPACCRVQVHAMTESDGLSMEKLTELLVRQHELMRRIDAVLAESEGMSPFEVRRRVAQARSFLREER